MLLFYLSLADDQTDKNKVEIIYNECYSYMCGKAATVLKNPSDIEDAVHNAMLKIIEHIDEIDVSDMARTKALCGIIARNKAVDMCRLKDNQPAEMYQNDASPETRVPPEEIVLGAETYRILVESIKKLDGAYKDIFTLKYLLNYKEREIAEILDIPPKTVATRIYRGKCVLRKMLEEEGLYV